jgi:hypothetical protein
MSFFDKLKSLGLFQPQGQGQQPQQNPYGLDPAMMRQAQMQSLGSIGSQIMALSQQMTPDQRARMMANADFSGGMQRNLYNAAQMKLMGDAGRRKEEEQAKAQQAQARIAEMIRQMPDGQTKKAAMFFLEAGDLAKAGEVIFTQKRQYNAATGGYDTVDAFGAPVGVAAPVAPGTPLSGGVDTIQTAPLPVMQPPGANQSVPIPAPDAGTSVMPSQPVDQVTTNWRRLTGDPTLTPQEARMIMEAAAAAGNTDAGLKVYRDIQKQKLDASTKDEDQATTALNQDRGAAEKIKSDFDASVKEKVKVVEAAQIAENIALDPSRSPAEKLTVLYRFITTLDPAGSVREGDTDLAQGLQSVLGRVAGYMETAASGGLITDQQMYDIVRAMGRLGTDARSRIEAKKIEALGLSESRKVPRDFVFGQMPRGPAMYPQPPIGYRVPVEARPSSGRVDLPPMPAPRLLRVEED